MLKKTAKSQVKNVLHTQFSFSFNEVYTTLTETYEDLVLDHVPQIHSFHMNTWKDKLSWYSGAVKILN